MLRKSLLLCALICTFFSVNILFADTVAFFKTDFDNGGTVVAGDPVIFTSQSVSTYPSMNCSWDFNNDGNTDATGDVVSYAFPTSGSFTVKLTVTAGEESDDYLRKFDVEPWLVELKSVGFKAATGAWHVIYRDIERTAYSNVPNEPYAENPQWEDNSDPLNGTATDSVDKKFPVCYTSGSLMQVQVIVEGRGPVPTPIWIKGAGPENFTFGSSGTVQVCWTSDGMNGVGYSVINCDNSFEAGKVRYWADFDIEWEVKCGVGGTFKKIGDSQNDLYVTKSDPMITGDNPIDEGKMYHTYVHLACANSNNQTTTTGIVNGIWSGFSGNDVVRRQDGEILIFNPWVGGPVDAKDLLTSKKGKSSAWSRLFIECLKVHSFHEENNYVFVHTDDDDEMMMFDSWSFSQTPVSLITNYPYSNVKDKEISNKHEWTYENVSDVLGIDGQNTPDPKSLFDKGEVYNLANFNGIYYDVAHGLSHTSFTDFENSLTGYAVTQEMNVAESIIKISLNDDDDTNDIVNTDVTGIKINPPGDQLDHSSVTQ